MSSSTKSKNPARKPHLLFINYYFPPMGGGGVQRITKFLKYFDYNDFQVSVLTVKESFFYSSDETLLSEIPPDVQVIRSGSLDPFRLIHLFKKTLQKLFLLSASPKQSNNESSGRLRRLAMSFFVPDSRLFWLPFACWRVWRLNRKSRIDIIVASMPPFTAGLIGIVSGKMLDKQVILDFRDAWTQNPYLPAVGILRLQINEYLERACTHNAAGFIFVNPALAGYYKQKYQAIEKKPNIIIRNGFDPDDFLNIKDRAGNEVFTIGAMGTIYSQGNRPITLLQAVRELYDQDPQYQKRLKLTFLGKWTGEFIALIKEYRLEAFVELIPYLPHQKSLRHAKQFDALTLSIESGIPGSAEVTPGRIYEYLNLKKPILAFCPTSSDLAELVTSCHAGEAVDYNHVTEAKSVIEDWVNDRPGLAKRYQFKGVDAFSRASQAASLMAFLKDTSR